MEIQKMESLRNIEQKDLPLLVLSDNLRSWVSARIKKHTHGSYNHLMWMVEPGKFISQNWMLQEQLIEKYFDGYRIKLWHNPNWTSMQKIIITTMLANRVRAPWYKRLYDPLQIVGIRLGVRWLQIPGIRICSDHSDILKKIEPDWNFKTGPSPEEINRYLETRPEYKVFGRYMED